MEIGIGGVKDIDDVLYRRVEVVCCLRHFRVHGRTTWYQSAVEIQADLDRFLFTEYNLKRSHQGYRLKGRTPAQALREAPGRKNLPNLDYSKDAKEGTTDQPKAA